MLNLQVGVFPGRVETFVVENGSTVEEVLAIAGLTPEAEQDIKVDGVIMGLDDTIGDNARLVLLSKRIKGA